MSHALRVVIGPAYPPASESGCPATRWNHRTKAEAVPVAGAAPMLVAERAR